MRRGPRTLARKLESLRYLVTRDRRAVAAFVCARGSGGVTRRARLRLVRELVTVTNHVRGYHTLSEMLAIADHILALAGRPGLTVVECGCGYGASTAKLSLVARAAGGRLIAFDSFRGIPDNDERHELLDGRPVVFRRGAFRKSLPAVRRVVEQFGAPEVVELRKGWFEETLASFDAPVDVAVLDVDLLASTRTCLRALAPRLRPGGAIFSQDGQLRATHALLADPAFWTADVGVPVPRVDGLGRAKQLVIRPR